MPGMDAEEFHCPKCDVEFVVDNYPWQGVLPVQCPICKQWWETEVEYIGDGFLSPRISDPAEFSVGDLPQGYTGVGRLE